MRHILYLVHRFPYPPNKGDRIRTFNIVKFLAGRSCLDVVTFADEVPSAADVTALSCYCRKLHVIPVSRLVRCGRAAVAGLRGRAFSEGAFASPALADRISRWAREISYDAVIASSSSMAPYLRLPALERVPAVVDLIDVDSEKWRAYAASSRGLKRGLYRLEARRLRRLEQEIARTARAVTLVSEEEANLFRRISGDGPVHAIPNGVDLDYFQPVARADAEQTCVFTGAMDYRPNVEGVEWFCHEVWPGLRERFPQCRFQIVGRSPSAAVRRLGRLPGVDVVGAVPDVRPYVARATVCVAPLRIARGVQNKVLEAMAMARPVVASPEALTGLAVRPGENALGASTPSEWTAALTRLFDDPELRSRLGRSARRYVEEHHDWGACLAPLAELLGLDGPGSRIASAAQFETFKPDAAQRQPAVHC